MRKILTLRILTCHLGIYYSIKFVLSKGKNTTFLLNVNPYIKKMQQIFSKPAALSYIYSKFAAQFFQTQNRCLLLFIIQ